MALNGPRRRQARSTNDQNGHETSSLNSSPWKSEEDRGSQSHSVLVHRLRIAEQRRFREGPTQVAIQLLRCASACPSNGEAQRINPPQFPLRFLGTAGAAVPDLGYGPDLSGCLGLRSGRCFDMRSPDFGKVGAGKARGVVERAIIDSLESGFLLGTPRRGGLSFGTTRS